MSSPHCYLCNCKFSDNKVYEHMFDQRCNADGIEQKTLAHMLAMVLGYRLHEEKMHSPFLCSTCKMTLLNYEAMEDQLAAARQEIIKMHSSTIDLRERLLATKQKEDDINKISYEFECDFPKNSTINFAISHSENIHITGLNCSVVHSGTDENDNQNKSESEDEDEDDDYDDDDDDDDDDNDDNDDDDDDDDDNNDGKSVGEDESEDESEDEGEKETEDEDGNENENEDEDEVDEGPAYKFKKNEATGTQSKALSLSGCKYCGKSFARRQWLEEHERVHTGERPHKCDMCNAAFAQRANLRTHILVTHQNQAKFQCQQCLRSFKRKRLLDNHIKSKHTLLRDLKCEHCEATFSNPVNLKKHRLCHTGEQKYKCRICGKHFSRLENRNAHQFVHSIRKPYACVVCDEGFMRKQQLKQHIAITQHSNPKIVRHQPLFSAANSNKLLQQ